MSRLPRKLDLETLVAAVAVLCFAVTLWQAYTRALLPFQMNFGEADILNAVCGC
jgi:hypothetical protein